MATKVTLDVQAKVQFYALREVFFMTEKRKFWLTTRGGGLVVNLDNPDALCKRGKRATQGKANGI